MSSFTICNIASVTLFDRAGSLSRIISSMMAGTICQRSPKGEVHDLHGPWGTARAEPRA